MFRTNWPSSSAQVFHFQYYKATATAADEIMSVLYCSKARVQFYTFIRRIFPFYRACGSFY
jgi:hypothetical protein